MTARQQAVADSVTADVRDALDRVEGFLLAFRQQGSWPVIATVTVNPGEGMAPHPSDVRDLTAEDLWAILGAIDMPLAASNAVGHPLRARLVEVIERQQVNPYKIADAVLGVVGRAIGGRR